MSLLELFQLLERKLGIELAYRQLPWRQSDQKFFVADNSKARQLLDWSPRTSKEQGIDSVLAWETEAQTLS